MKLLKRSTTVAVALAGVLAVSAAPASAIVGGQDATQSYPGMAAAQIVFPGLGTALCGASVIHPRWALIAAHCVSDQAAAPTPIAMPGGNVTLRIASNDRTAGGQLVAGKQVYLYPGWAWGATWPASPVADLALVELAQPVHAPIMRLDTRQPPEGGATRLIGWGLTAYPPAPGTTPPTMLHQKDTTRLPATACAGGFIGTGDICLGGGACFGDSGGPALHQVYGGPHSRRPVWASVGVASRETSADNPCEQPSVYTDPTHWPFRLWIWTTIRTGQQPPCTCPPTPAATTASNTLTGTLKLKHFH
jgi:secreted trypsin-like serine protease